MPTSGKDEGKIGIKASSGSNEKELKKIGNKDAKEKELEELSEEDTALKEGLELAVARLQDESEHVVHQALDHLINEIRSSTSSMTSVPKPLKFLRPHYAALKSTFETLSPDVGKKMADILSVLAMTMSEPGSRECLNYKLKGTTIDISSWGHEYVRCLAGEISEEYNKRALESQDDIECDDLMQLVDDILPFQMEHNAEAEAIDLLMEVQQLSKLTNKPIIDERNYERVCLYLLRCANFVSDPDDLATLFKTAYIIYKNQGKHTDALRVALKIGDTGLVEVLFSDETNASEILKKQMALMLGRQRSSFVHRDEELNSIIDNTLLSERYLAVARNMDVLEPKSPEDIYKTSSNEGSGLSRLGRSGPPVDSARANLASSFVNAFVNAGFGVDKLLSEEGNSWVFKNKDHGMISAAASLGMVFLWNIDEGLSQVDKFFHHSDDNIKAGACLAVGILSSGVRHESDPTLALLTDYIEKPQSNIRLASICGLGIAYAGQQREEISGLLSVIIENTSADITEVSLAALSLGVIFVGTCNDEVGSVLVQVSFLK